MVTFNDMREEDEGDVYDSKTFKDYKRFKNYQKQVENNPASKSYIEKKYFNCLFCGKTNLYEDIINERSENRTMRARYITWKKLKDISNELGGSMENGLNYLFSLHENVKQEVSDERTIGIAGFGGGGDNKHKRKKR